MRLLGVLEDAATREVKAKKQITDAEKELSKAREQAIEDLQQIGFESEDAALIFCFLKTIFKLFKGIFL